MELMTSLKKRTEQLVGGKSVVFLYHKSIQVLLDKLLIGGRWKRQPELTDELLTLVESNMKWMVAFGFDKSSASSRLTIIECCGQIAWALLITDKPGTPFGPANLKKLMEAVKNCISSLVRLGMVLLFQTTNMKLHLGLRSQMFTMHELAGTSPVASCVAISNSTSSLDLSVLDRLENDADVFDKGGDITESTPHDSSPLNNSHLGSPGFDIEWPPSEGEVTAPLSIPEPKAKLTVKHPASPCTGHSSVKRKKTTQELAHEIVEGEHAAQLQISLNSAKEKTRWECIKRETAQEMALEIEQLCLKHQQEEGDCQHT
ncbi:hypothetical protein F5J12DRAFT_785843 [Pisolithus orientalis]|uniref:uncharacterized protein n=1 Tax=Pisolithus orientalis TaxID=936130 RepID=UPI002224D737|nr:uncharacterized protein F5J12DRAFT_785843 [Pisolithus orientalis]KAI5994283.1 hypothetical protein F5J12DRAFT_785843 [Pisolithus orientalis]